MFEDIKYIGINAFILYTNNTLYSGYVDYLSAASVYTVVPDIAVSKLNNEGAVYASMPTKKQITLYKLRHSNEHSYSASVYFHNIVNSIIYYDNNKPSGKCEFLSTAKNAMIHDGDDYIYIDLWDNDNNV